MQKLKQIKRYKENKIISIIRLTLKSISTMFYLKKKIYMTLLRSYKYKI